MAVDFYIIGERGTVTDVSTGSSVLSRGVVDIEQCHITAGNSRCISG